MFYLKQKRCQWYEMFLVVMIITWFISTSKCFQLKIQLYILLMLVCSCSNIAFSNSNTFLTHFSLFSAKFQLRKTDVLLFVYLRREMAKNFVKPPESFKFNWKNRRKMLDRNKLMKVVLKWLMGMFVMHSLSLI